jgi:hypothetical protein
MQGKHIKFGVKMRHRSRNYGLEASHGRSGPQKCGGHVPHDLSRLMEGMVVER